MRRARLAIMAAGVSAAVAQDECATAPWLPACKDYVYPTAQKDLQDWCTSTKQPGHDADCVCEISTACQQGQVSGPYCKPMSMLADVCRVEMPLPMNMEPCIGYNRVCLANSTVEQCTTMGALPQFLPTKKAKEASASICESMPAMSGCRQSLGPLAKLVNLCQSMQSMSQCNGLTAMCTAANADGKFNFFCKGFSGDGGIHTGDEYHCTGRTVMYMQGFTWGFEGDVCPVALFWALDSRATYATGLVLTVLFGILYEALSYTRRRAAVAATDGSSRCLSVAWQARAVDAGLHVTQLTLGYCLMLLTMTYHLWLFIAVILGLGLGHCLFAYRGPHPAGGGEAFSGKDPCCPVTPILGGGKRSSADSAGINAPLLSVAGSSYSVSMIYHILYSI